MPFSYLDYMSFAINENDARNDPTIRKAVDSLISKKIMFYPFRRVERLVANEEDQELFWYPEEAAGSYFAKLKIALAAMAHPIRNVVCILGYSPDSVVLDGKIDPEYIKPFHLAVRAATFLAVKPLPVSVYSPVTSVSQKIHFINPNSHSHHVKARNLCQALGLIDEYTIVFAQASCGLAIRQILADVTAMQYYPEKERARPAALFCERVDSKALKVFNYQVEARQALESYRKIDPLNRPVVDMLKGYREGDTFSDFALHERIGVPQNIGSEGLTATTLPEASPSMKRDVLRIAAVVLDLECVFWCVFWCIADGLTD
ncbi:hypothetical protein P280DRAFT_515769 [Massarina eburnea CBS 473.64]|uniref:Uncharacterized protein n=1 Tax=Massarina eburnea CBS 473.64 TaxID=1395130 RepID=A0A6A6S808_9PLEO|nr:hypothetical protein P280DRAFT_515769 [Massarina eburnea CBS 473.64]